MTRTLTLITEQILARVPGGAGRYAAQASTALAAGTPPGWRIDGVVGWHRDVGPARISGVGGPRRLPADPRMLARLWRYGWPPRPGGAVVHAFTPLFPPPRRGQRMVVTVFDQVPFTHPETLTAHGAAWHRVMIGRACAIADAIVVPTQAVADGLAQVGLHPRGRVEVIGAGVSVRPRTDPEALARLALPPEYLLVVGTLEPRKGLDVLLDALAELPGRHLAVVGQPGWGGTDVTAEAARRSLADRVHVLGRLSDDDLAVVLTAAAVVVLPSRAEGFGLPLLEAMACGVPVVHSSVPALDEVAGGAAIGVPVGDPVALAQAVGMVLQDEALADRLRRAGITRARNYSWRNVADRLWDLYAAL